MLDGVCWSHVRAAAVMCKQDRGAAPISERVLQWWVEGLAGPCVSGASPATHSRTPPKVKCLKGSVGPIRTGRAADHLGTICTEEWLRGCVWG